jgi:hypothetical protein
MARIERLSISLAKNGYRARQRSEDNRVTSRANARVTDANRLSKLTNLRKMAHRNGFRTTYVTKDGKRKALNYDQLKTLAEGRTQRYIDNLRKKYVSS